nr:peptidase C48, SUMO/sentrin/Ubl1 [Tanacetum cinerariifolium]
MGIAEILDNVGEKEENEEKEELYELIEESIESILIDKSKIEEKINENLIKFQNDERLIQLRDMMKAIFKEPNIPEYHSSSSTESDDYDDDNSQVGDDNEKSYGTQTDSAEEDHVQIVTKAQQEERKNMQYTDEENDEKEETGTSKKYKANNNNEEGIANTKDKNQKIVGEVPKDERNENQNIAECSEKKMNKKRGHPKNDEADNNKKEGMANKKATNQKINEEIDPFDDLTFGEYNLQNEHLFVPTQTSAVKKKDQTDDVDWETQHMKKMKILSEKKKKMGLKSKYVNKTMDPAVELTEDEKLLGRSIFSTQEEEEEEVFNDNERMILFRMNIQALAPGLEIDTSVIDVHVSILNYEEIFKMTNMKRHFFYTSMMVPGILENKTKEIDKKMDAQYDRFYEILSIQMETDVEKNANGGR